MARDCQPQIPIQFRPANKEQCIGGGEVTARGRRPPFVIIGVLRWTQEFQRFCVHEERLTLFFALGFVTAASNLGAFCRPTPQSESCRKIYNNCHNIIMHQIQRLRTPLFPCPVLPSHFRRFVNKRPLPRKIRVYF